MLKVFFCSATILYFIIYPAQSQTKSFYSWITDFANLSDKNLGIEIKPTSWINTEVIDLPAQKITAISGGRMPPNGTAHIYDDMDHKNRIYAVRDRNGLNYATLILIKYENNVKKSIEECYYFPHSPTNDYGYQMAYHNNTMNIMKIDSNSIATEINPSEYGNSTYGCQDLFDELDT